MKKTLLFFTLIGTFLGASAQEASSEWLEQLFTPEVISSLDQSKLDYYLAADQLGYRVEDVAPKDISELPDALAISAKNELTPALSEELLEGDFHYMLYNFAVKNDESLYYKIGDTGKSLVIYSVQYTMKKIETQLYED